MKHKVLIIAIAVILLCVVFGILCRKEIEKHFYPQKYSDIVSRYAALYDLPEHFVYAVIKTESDFDKDAISSAGAVGLMQIMPSTFVWLTELTDEEIDINRLSDPEINIRYGCFYLRYLYDIYEDKTLTLAAYNAGMGNVKKWLDAGGGTLKEIPFEETKNYINRVLRFEEKYNALYPKKGQTK